MEADIITRGRGRGHALMAMLAARRAREAAQSRTAEGGWSDIEDKGMPPSEPLKSPDRPISAPDQESPVGANPRPVELLAPRLAAANIGAHASTINIYFMK